MALDGLVIRLDLPELKQMISLLRYTSNNINQIHAITHFWRSFPKTDQERESFEKEVADCLERDLRNYRIHTGVLKP